MEEIGRGDGTGCLRRLEGENGKMKCWDLELCQTCKIWLFSQHSSVHREEDQLLFLSVTSVDIVLSYKVNVFYHTDHVGVSAIAYNVSGKVNTEVSEIHKMTNTKGTSNFIKSFLKYLPPPQSGFTRKMLIFFL